MIGGIYTLNSSCTYLRPEDEPEMSFVNNEAA